MRPAAGWVRTSRRIRTGHAERGRDQRGVVAGAESVLFVALLLVGGGVVAAAGWSSIRSQVALDAAAREYLRAYTEAPDPLTAAHRGEQAARRSLRGHGVDDSRVTLRHADLRAFGPCALAEVGLELRVPAVRVPFVDEWRPITVSTRRRELVDIRREMIRGPDHRPAGTVRGG